MCQQQKVTPPPPDKAGTRGGAGPTRAGLSPLPCGQALEGLRGVSCEPVGWFPAALGSSALGPAGSAVGVRLRREAAGCPPAAGGPFPSAPDKDTRGDGAQSPSPVGPLQQPLACFGRCRVPPASLKRSLHCGKSS